MTGGGSPKPLRHTTLRVGTMALAASAGALEIDLRILLGSDDAYRVLVAGALSDPLSSLEAAPAHAKCDVGEPAGAAVRWRDDGEPLHAGERACPICGSPAPTSPRYPRSLCPACVTEVTDAEGRSLRLENTGMSGGFAARHTDDGSSYVDGVYFVRGVPCVAGEHRFGGVVLQLAD
jgi:hypothetical protein